ncbi:unnamed protein product [Mytilus edulis]|uniref:Uncharacterized protein n=1 Tax=Mytilus edulis TaxID=6550 RepID=A0A8S3R9H1_MYTED|nr:unnamed protein product [Mytilus edulis]
MEDLAREAESAASNQRMGQIYQVTKQLSGKKAKINMPIKDKNNNMLTTERDQYLRWKEHFQEVLNRKDPDELTIIPEAPIDLEIDTDPPSKQEIQKAIKSLKNKKAPGIDQLNAELFKIDPVLAADTLHPVFKKIWEQAVIPNSWSEGNIITIPKSGDLTNFRHSSKNQHSFIAIYYSRPSSGVAVTTVIKSRCITENIDIMSQDHWCNCFQKHFNKM